MSPYCKAFTIITFKICENLPKPDIYEKFYRPENMTKGKMQFKI